MKLPKRWQGVVLCLVGTAMGATGMHSDKMLLIIGAVLLLLCGMRHIQNYAYGRTDE